MLNSDSRAIKHITSSPSMFDISWYFRPAVSECHLHSRSGYLVPPSSSPSQASSSPPLSLSARDRCPELNRAIQSVRYIAAFTKEEIENNKAKEDWKFVAMVLDRLFLWIFSVAVIGEIKGFLLDFSCLTFIHQFNQKSFHSNDINTSILLLTFFSHH